MIAVKYCDLKTVKYLCEKHIINLDDNMILKQSIHNKKQMLQNIF